MKKRIQEGLLGIYQKIITLMNPDYDLGIEPVRLRGSIRIIIGVLLTPLMVFIAMGGFSTYSRLDLPEYDSGEEGVISIEMIAGIILMGIPIFLVIAALAHILWGIVELLTNKSWNEASPLKKYLSMLLVSIALFVSIIYLALGF